MRKEFAAALKRHARGMTAENDKIFLAILF